VEEVRKSSYSV